MPLYAGFRRHRLGRDLFMRSACLFTWTLVVAAPAGALAETPQEDAILQAVVEYADNVLRLGRDADTPLFADGLHVDTRQPAEFDGWALSNLADQQNLFRVLAGLTRLTGDPRYVNAAQEAVVWHFERQHPSGLLNWGHHRLIDLRTGAIVGDGGMPHELKFPDADGQERRSCKGPIRGNGCLVFL